MMNKSWLLGLALVGWLAIGIALGMILGRRGHDGYGWFVLGALLGPFAALLAAQATKEEGLHPQVLREPALAAEGGIDVLVGIDDSPESRAALASAIHLFGDRLGRLTLVTVIPFDGGLDDARSAEALLSDAANEVPDLSPGLQVVRGHPSAALKATASAGDYDVISIGTTGAGHAHLFGSAARELSHHCDVPVLLATASSPAARRSGERQHGQRRYAH